MDMLEKSVELHQLYDIYQELLTSKQKEYFEMYYFDDLSITEISENLDVSRNAVHDLLKRTIHKLYDYEQKLHLNDHTKQRHKLIEQIQHENNNQTIARLLEELAKVE